MKAKLLTCLAVVATVLSGCVIATGNNGISINGGKDSDATVKKEIKAAAFNEIQASQGIKVIVSQGKYPGVVSVATTPSAEKYLQVNVNDGKLKVYYDNKGTNVKKINGPSIITVTIPELEEADLSSGANLILKGSFKSGNKMELDLSSGSSVNIENLTCPELSLDTSSGAGATIERLDGNLEADASSGSAITVKAAKGNSLEFSASSGSSVTGDSLEGSNLEFKASSGGSISAGSVKATATKAGASSGGSITISGKTTTLDRHTSSGGSVDTSRLSVN